MAGTMSRPFCFAIGCAAPSRKTFFITFVDRIFTASIGRAFTKKFDATRIKPYAACV
jgi:hypothetical protein